jgi:two-component system, OmpR family, sensor kinase
VARRDRQPARWTASIRLRLLSGFALALVLGLLGSFLTTSLLLQDYLRDRDRRTLQASSQRVRALVASGPQLVDGEQLEVLLGYPLGAVVVARDRALAATGTAEPDAQALVTRTRQRTGEVVELELQAGGDLLAQRVPAPGLRVRVGPGEVVTADAVVVAVDTDIDDADVRRLLRSQALVVGGAVVLVTLLALLFIRRGLRPLTAMAGTAEEIAAGERGRRLEQDGGGPETAQLAGAVNRAFDAQAAAEAKIRAFAADASHELRTPLATISGWLDLHHQGALEAPGRLEHALERVDREVGRMRLMVEELSLLARLDAGRALERAPVDVAALARDVVEDAQVVSHERHFAFAGPSGADGSARVLGDEARLAQVLRNLVGNAVQHTPPAAGVRVTVTVDREAVRVRIADDGPGIPPEQLPHLFERFWRAEASRSRAHGGSGLGLAIVQAIVTAHGGTVAVTSRPGEGTAFTATLPRLAD